jgi:hypothetical protein
MVVVGGEDAGYGHVGRDAGVGDSDCWGCHGFAMPSLPDPGDDPAPYHSTFGDMTEADCRLCHDAGLPDRHHVLYGQSIIAGSVAPYPDANGDSSSDTNYVCLNCHGTNFFVVRDCRVCHQEPAVRNVNVDIKPGSDANTINLKSKGVLPVAILGSSDYDVTEIDVSSLLLEGEVAPLRSSLQEGADGNMNLMLKFSSEAVRDALGDLQPGQTYDVCITGTFTDGSNFLGCDSVAVVPRK